MEPISRKDMDMDMDMDMVMDTDMAMGLKRKEAGGRRCCLLNSNLSTG